MVTKIQKHFLDHKHNARKRGIKFTFSFDLWLQTWEASGHLYERGPYKGQYVMARFGDKGAYEVSNIKIVKVEENHAEKKLSKKTRELLRMQRLGKKRNAKVRAAISAGRTGIKYSAEGCRKLSISRLGRKHSAETCAKISRANMGHACSEETRAKIGRAAKLRAQLRKNKND